jgi:PAS domain-containing protein
MLRTSYFNPGGVGYDSTSTFGSFSSFPIYLVILIIDLYLFAVIEKFMKENWVIRDSSDKSFKQLLAMIDDHPQELFVMDQNMNIQFFNKKFEESVDALQKDKFPKSAKDLIHNDENESYTASVMNVIQDQQQIKKSINLSRSITDVIEEFKEGKAPMFTDSKEEYNSVINPLNWKGSKAVMITLQSIQEQRVKSKLLENHANDISSQFQRIIQHLEDDLSLDGQHKNNPEDVRMISFKKNILMQVIKIFNEFLCIENVFKIDCGTLKLEPE